MMYDWFMRVLVSLGARGRAAGFRDMRRRAHTPGVVDLEGVGMVKRREAIPPPWLGDPDRLRAMADQFLDYFNTCPDPLVGLESSLFGFRLVHRLGDATFYNSDRQYKGADATYAGDIVSLGNAENTMDGQAAELRARILGAEVETPAEYRHYMIFQHTYRVLVD